MAKIVPPKLSEADATLLNGALMGARFDEIRRGIDFNAERGALEAERKQKEEDFTQVTGKHLRPASLNEYKAWLAKHIQAGGAISHSYDYPMPLDSWYVAERDIEIRPLHGASSVHIIVPDQVQIKGGELGHNSLYFMSDGSNRGGFVPIYSDIEFKPNPK